MGHRERTKEEKTNVGVKGSLERDISSLRAFGLGGRQISRVVHLSARAAFVFCSKVWFRARGAHIYRISVVSCKRDTHFSKKKCDFVQEGHAFIEKV